MSLTHICTHSPHTRNLGTAHLLRGRDHPTASPLFLQHHRSGHGEERGLVSRQERRNQPQSCCSPCLLQVGEGLGWSGRGGRSPACRWQHLVSPSPLQQRHSSLDSANVRQGPLQRRRQVCALLQPTAPGHLRGLRVGFLEGSHLPPRGPLQPPCLSQGVNPVPTQGHPASPGGGL